MGGGVREGVLFKGGEVVLFSRAGRALSFLESTC